MPQHHRERYPAKPRILARHVPLELQEVASGTAVLDWTVPREWNIRGAYVARLDGTRLVDFAANNLHIVQYSVPTDAVVSREELRRHIHVLPDHPTWIPYRTSYYNETWGFCLAQSQLDALTDQGTVSSKMLRSRLVTSPTANACSPAIPTRRC
jgi:aminopeptidase-like protein